MPRKCPDRCAQHANNSLTRPPAPVEDMSDEENGDIPFADAKGEAVDGDESNADDDEDDEDVEEGV